MSFQRTKIDGNLGYEIHEYLKSIGMETPMIDSALNVDPKDKIAQIEHLMTEVWKILGMDLSDDSLMETPKRIAKMMVLEHYWGLLPENFPKNTCIENKMKVDEMVTLGEIPVMSNCEHHGVIFTGNAVVSYMPKDKVIGISKLARVVEYFSRRPQVQERLTSQIFHALSYMLGTDDVAVGIRAQHYCMISRGVEATNTWTQTTKLGGAYRENLSTKTEFLRMLK